VGLDTEGAERLGLTLGVVRAALGLGALVTFLACALALVDRAVERRTADASLLVLGLSTRTLRAAQAWEAGLTTGAGLVLATVAGVVGSLAWQFTLTGNPAPDTRALAVLATGAALTAVTSVLLAAVVSPRALEPGHLRLD
jgi:hypothetical protein